MSHQTVNIVNEQLSLQNALIAAVSSNDYASVAELLKNGADANTVVASEANVPLLLFALGWRSSVNMRVLGAAQVLASNSKSIVSLLLQAGADIHACAPDGCTTLIATVCLGWEDLITQLLQLVEHRKLDIDRPIISYLPDYRQDTGSKITIKHLLSHTSGLPLLDDAMPEQNGVAGIYTATDTKLTDAAYMVKTYCSGDLIAEPGEKFNYNNADYIILQAILERITALSYDRLLQRQILKPLGMRHTGLTTKDAYAKGQAIGYALQKGQIVPEPYVHVPNFGAAGAMYSTANDLLRWNRAFDQDKLLSKKYRELMFTPYPVNGYGALGSWVFPFYAKNVTKKPLIIDREGEIGAFNLSDLRVPEDRLSVLVFSNVEAPDRGAAYMGKGIVFDLLKTLYTVAPETTL